ncbi:unnamed protein product [Rotaria socialis]|uniref:Uncharacterized protein n=1 Tax=Rotaria socialis TaxID=392032 RepID=A0A818BFM4_9BILA|nr:unnamed protein product [Rotaria socialis]CAF3731866.1 unnamed protein product [Rotaria socialis]
MKDAIVIFICFILIILFGFSVASWSLLTTKEQVIWPNSTNESFSNATVVVQGADVSSSWQLLRDVFNWGIWKVFGQVAEPYNDAVSGTDEVIPFTVVEKYHIYSYCFRKRRLWHICFLIFNWLHRDIQCTASECAYRDV